MSRLKGNENTESCCDKDNLLVLEQLMEQYGRAIFSYCYHLLRKKEDAEDAVQEVFIKAYQNYSRTGVRNFSLWIYRVAYNHCMNVIRHRRKLGIFVSLEDSLPSTFITPEDQLSRLETRTLVQKALNGLSSHERNIVVLRAIHHLSYDDISKIILRNTVSIRKIYERSKKKMANYLDSYEKEAKQDEKREA